MVTKTRGAQLKKGIRNVDDILYIFTGKRLKHVAGRAINIFGEDIARKVGSIFTGPDEPELPPDSPYSILGVHPDALDIVVKASRTLAREYHPDTGSKPDVAKFQAVIEAYDAIMAARSLKKEDADGGRANDLGRAPKKG